MPPIQDSLQCVNRLEPAMLQQVNLQGLSRVSGEVRAGAVPTVRATEAKLSALTS
jgi:hypothetical protein